MSATEQQWAAWFREAAAQADDLTEGQREGFRLAAEHLDSPHIQTRVARVTFDEETPRMTAPTNDWFTPPARVDVHTLDERCFWCVSGAEAATPVGAGGFIWRWGASSEQCPFWTNETEVTR